MPLSNVTEVSSLASGKAKVFVKIVLENGNVYESCSLLHGLSSHLELILRLDSVILSFQYVVEGGIVV